MSDPTASATVRESRDPVTLRVLAQDADVSPVRVLVAPAGLDVRVSGTVIHDPEEPIPHSPGAVLLLVGVTIADIRAREALRRAAEREFAAVVVKRRGHAPEPLIEEARACGIAVLTVDDAMPWRNVDAGVSCALAAHGSGETTGSAPAGGEELFALADALAAAVGGSVAIEDLDQNVVAYSKVAGVRIDSVREWGILHRRVPDVPEQRRQYRQVLAATGAVRFPAMGEELPRAAVAIRAGALPLGTLWAIEPEEGLSGDAELQLLDAARFAAPHLLRALNLPEAERRMRRDTLRAVLHRSGPPADEAADLLGLRPGVEFCLTAFAPAAPGRGSAGTGEAATVGVDSALLTHVEWVLMRHCAAHRATATVAADASAVYVLLPATGQAAGRRFADSALAAVRRSVGDGARAAVSRPYTDLGQSAALRREADGILRATAYESPGQPAAATSDVRHRILLDRLGDELERDAWLRLSEVDALLAHDRTQGTDYGATAIAWLDATGDIASAAARLKVHPNTLRHRLRRIHELFHIDLGDPDVRLAAWLELRRAAPSDRSHRRAAGPGHP
ncbi:helix-turn-helix domain-containing protein [Streptomyces sp. Je 1-79]|uniref:PucR family transcriptional regulator n=1 Tax=Streptomyces sp. Je 1-79 TaxID=2943847 RepID=UPI0021A96C11|nr:PucR family transcriptional regulator [Streptomyces sp. Je 1-79]MCT4357850.1 helix-turn-helix domain-containing protein [Streptomyces sp. Je 1-79]